jgi:predicted transposase YbfD/YdcC
LLNVKDNRQILKKEIAEYVQEKGMRKRMDSHTTREKTSGRVGRRTAYTTGYIGWLYSKEGREKPACIGATNTRFTGKKGTSDEWRYYISGRGLTAEELLRHARLEWTVETMHWLLDVHFGEDFCRIENRNAQQNLNIVRKIALNTIKDYKNKTVSKRPVSRLMFDCLLEPENIRSILTVNEN